MASKVIKLTESDLKLIVSNILKEQQEKVYADHDTKYDYKVSKGNWVASKKGANKWFSLQKYPTTILKLNKKYPSAIKSNNEPKSEKKIDFYTDFANAEQGNSFRKFVNKKFPKIAKKYQLDVTGKHDNSYIKKVAKLKMVASKDLYGGRISKGDSLPLYMYWNSYTAENKPGAISKMGDKIKSTFDGMLDSIVGDDYKPTKGNFIIPFVFPEYEPKVDKKSTMDKWLIPITRLAFGGDKEDSYGKLGHAGIATVSPDGSTNLYEFGRYQGAKEGYGITKSKKLGKISKFKEDGSLENFESVCSTIKSKTEGQGPSLSMDCRLVPVPNVKNAISKASETTSKPYEGIDMDSTDDDANCGTFTIEIAKAAGVPLGTYCFPNPTLSIGQFDIYSLESKVV